MSHRDTILKLLEREIVGTNMAIALSVRREAEQAIGQPIAPGLSERLLDTRNGLMMARAWFAALPLRGDE